MQRNAGGKYKPWFYSSLIYEPHKTYYLAYFHDYIYEHSN